MPCKHAALAAIYAKQMAEMDEPWKLWRGRMPNWVGWHTFRDHFYFDDKWEYEQISKTININGRDV